MSTLPIGEFLQVAPEAMRLSAQQGIPFEEAQRRVIKQKEQQMEAEIKYKTQLLESLGAGIFNAIDTINDFRNKKSI